MSVDEIDEEVASILFQRYKSDDGSNNNYLCVDKLKEHRKSLRSITPIQFDDLERRWLKSSSRCDLDDLKRLLERDFELINKKDFFTGFAAVHWAAKKGRIDVVSWLSEQKADMNIRTNGGYTPLHIATIHNNSVLIKRLIKEFDADINLRDYSGRKARHYVSNELPFAVYRALQETPSIIDMKVDPHFLLASPNNVMPYRVNSVPTSKSMPVIAEKSPPTEVKKKKKGLSLSHSFKGKRPLMVMRRHRDNSPSDGKPRWRKALSVPDVSAISAPIIAFEENI